MEEPINALGKKHYLYRLLRILINNALHISDTLGKHHREDYAAVNCQG